MTRRLQRRATVGTTAGVAKTLSACSLPGEGYVRGTCVFPGGVQIWDRLQNYHWRHVDYLRAYLNGAIGRLDGEWHSGVNYRIDTN